MVERASLSPIDDALRGEKPSLRETLKRFHLLTLARRVHRTLRIPGRLLLFTGVNTLLLLGRMPVLGPRVDSLLERIDRRLRHTMAVDEVLRVCAALESSGLTYWVAGGWGIDILAGFQTRQHCDLDIVVDHFWENLHKIDATITGLGYRRVAPLGGIIWFPNAAAYEDREGHRLEVVDVNWEVLAASRDLFAPTVSSASATPMASGEAMAELVAQCTTTGKIASVTLPALSLRAQRLFHLGFPARPEHRHDAGIIRLLSTDSLAQREPEKQSGAALRHSSFTPSTLLLIPIFSYPPELWRLCKLYHNDLDKVPPHVTLAFPFLPVSRISSDIVRELTQIFNDVAAFDFELAEIKWFGTDVIYLEPSASATFRAIIGDLQTKFPDFHPYEDAFPSVVPHVTLSEHGSRFDRRMLGKRASKFLPIPAQATQVWMMSNEEDEHSWSIVKIFPLASTN